MIGAQAWTLTSMMMGNSTMTNERPDWQIITLAIRRHYKPLSQVAKEVGSDWRHMCRLARGEVLDTKYKVGCRLLRIYADICKKLNRQPEWTANPEIIQIMPRVEVLESPPLYGYSRPVNSLPELARKILKRGATA
jgi:hypothetical protein